VTSDRDEAGTDDPPERQNLWYLDTSVAIRILLGDPATVDWWNAQVRAGDAFVGSQLLRLEMIRVCRREDLDTQEVDDFVTQLTLTDVDNALLNEAAAITPHVKALDALHVASARRIGSATVVTHDGTMIKVAEQVGLSVLDPVAD